MQLFSSLVQAAEQRAQVAEERARAAELYISALENQLEYTPGAGNAQDEGSLAPLQAQMPLTQTGFQFS